MICTSFWQKEVPAPLAYLIIAAVFIATLLVGSWVMQGESWFVFGLLEQSTPPEWPDILRTAREASR